MHRASLVLALFVAGCGEVGGAADSGPGPLSDADLTSRPDLAGAPDLGGPVSLPRIVPFTPAAHAPFPTLPSGDGVVLTPTRVVTIVAQNDAFHDQLLAFGLLLTTSSWWQVVAAPYGLATAATPVTATGPAITNNLTESTLKRYVTTLVNQGTVPAPDGKSVYMVYLPDGVSLNSPNTTDNANCALYEGYHTQYGTLGDNIAFSQRCVPSSMPGSLDDVTNTASHEIIEAASDPTGGGWAFPAPPTMQPWTADVWATLDSGAVTENADLCAGSNFVERGFQYQRVWSNGAASAGGDPCVPAIAQPYLNVSAPKGWYATDGSGRADIPLTGWSTARIDDWGLGSEVYDPTVMGWTVTIQSQRMVTVNGKSRPAINNGETITLSVTAPPGAARGSFQGFVIYSYPTAPGGDDYHMFPVGAYVP